MSYVLVENFSAGVDQSRPIFVGTPGTLWEGINGHISRGGDFEKRKAFVDTYTLPVGTFGMAAANNTLYVFGGGTDPGVPSGVTYQQLAHPSASAMTELLSVTVFDGFIYAVAKYLDGSVHHFYNGARVADWDGGSGLPAIKGDVVLTMKKKIYACANNLLYYSGVNTPAGWDSTPSTGDVGAGFLNMSNHQEGAGTLTGLGVYQDKLTVFSPNVTQLWFVADDDAANFPAQTLLETGTRSPRSVRGYGDIDLFYLSDTGIRSLRARDSNNVAGVQDVGTPIDPVVTTFMDSLTETQIRRACTTVDPRDARFWLALGNRIFVFSYYPSKKISAWTWYEPGFQIDDMVSLNKRVHVRSGNKVYVYGGSTGQVYDSCRVTAQLPFMNNGKPGHYKTFTGMDVSAVGSWDARVLMAPDDMTQYVDFGELSGVTWPQENTAGVGMATHVAPQFVNEAAGPASLSQVGLHFQMGESE